MARQRRIEFPGATYHIMARGDRKEPIVYDDFDRRVFLSTLGEMCQRTGIIIHAYVLLNNHYHLILETPEGNLVDGMKWFQNTYTRRINVRHDLWGHLFGGRYKSILIDRTGDYFIRAVDYVHLNPLRADQTSIERGIAAYPWCSLADFNRPPKSRPIWLCPKSVFGSLDLKDTPKGRKDLVSKLEAKALKVNPNEAGLVTSGNPEESSLQATIQRGWYFGSKTFKEALLDQLESDEADSKYEIEGGFSGSQKNDHSISAANKIIEEYCRKEGVTLADLVPDKANNPVKALIAEKISSETSVSLDWIRKTLSMGSRSYCSRLINDKRRELASQKS
jgi:REP element-mobilizing transposase RayT